MRSFRVHVKLLYRIVHMRSHRRQVQGSLWGNKENNGQTSIQSPCSWR